MYKCVSKHLCMFLRYSLPCYFSMPIIASLSAVSMPLFTFNLFRTATEPILTAHAYIYTRALIYVLVSTNLDMCALSHSQSLFPFTHTMHSKFHKYSVETGPMCDLMLTLLFAVQSQFVFSMLWPLWHNIQGGNNSLFRINGWRKYQYGHAFSCFQYFYVSMNGRSFYVSTPYSFTHIWGCENFGVKDSRIRSSIWIATHFLPQSKMYFTWTSNSAGGIWVPVKTHKLLCVPSPGWLSCCYVPGGLASAVNGAQWMTQLTLQQKPARDQMNHSLGSFPVLPRLLLILNAQLTSTLKCCQS